MSFNEELNLFFDDYILEYKNKPTKNKTYIFADFVELLTLFSKGTIVGPDFFLDRLEEKFPLDKRFFRNIDHEGFDAEEPEEISENENQIDNDEDRPELNDLKQVFSESIFRLINERNTVFKDDYPFKVNGNSIVLKDDLTSKQKIYLILLLCSSLDIFSKFKNTLTTEFELISFSVLKNYLPNHAVVKSFGKNSDYPETYAIQKIKKLAADMKIGIFEDALSQISQLNMQEKGLDLIGWVPFEDSISNYFCVLAQCACEKEFNKKLAESSRYNRYLKFHVLSPTPSLFLPYSLVQNSSSKNFIRFDEFSIDTLVFERKRILEFINAGNDFNSLRSMQIVEKCIAHQERIT